VGRRAGRRFRPRLEQLEDRTLLNGPSAFGHITDGQFDVINGHQEWSDITPTFFPSTHSYLYADQANLNHPPGSPPDTFMLMYDDVGLTTPLGPNQFIPIRFNTVENEGGHDHLNFYEVHIFTDGTITFLENGVVQRDDNGNIRVSEIGGQQGKAGFGTSPNSSTPHVMAEFQITLSANQTVLNGGYSPDPLFWSSDPPPPPPPPCPPNQFTTIPITVNLLNNSGLTPAQAAQVVSEASDLLNGANSNLHLQLTINGAVNTGINPVTANDINQNGILDQTELDNLQRAAQLDIGAGRGIEVTFANQIPAQWGPGETELGLPSSVVVKRPGDTLDQTAIILAHELGHVFGLMHTTDPTNIMTPVEPPGSNTLLTNQQAMDICDNLSNFGVSVTTNSPGQLNLEQFGAVVKSNVTIGPGVPQYFDLFRIAATSQAGASDINASLTLNGLFPASGPVDATYRFLFDTDHNSATGVSTGGFSGIDKEVLIHVTGDASVAPLALSGVVIDYDNGGRQTSLPGSPHLLHLDEGAYGNSQIPVFDQITFQIPKSLLQLSADDVPVGVVSQNAMGIQDTTSLVFDADLYLDEPALNLTQASAFVNDPVNFTLQNLHPNSAFTLTLGSQQVLTGTTDSAGSFSGTFTVPSLPSGSTFLTAQDSTGAFAFNVLDIFPPLGTSTILPGFNAHILPANDDDSTGAVPLGFTVNFFGHNYSTLYVNNNGNVTFDSPLSAFTPFDLTSTGHVIVAPFFADVDTRLGNVLTYGTGTVDGHPAFGVTWPGVGYYSEHTDKLNAFQMVLIDRSDFAPGDFDIEFNYGQIQWETGDASGGVNGFGGASARVGFSNGTGQPGTFFELPGSGVHGAFLDGNSQTGLINNSANSPDPGQYVFQVRAGTPLVHNTAAFLQANADGTTTVEPTSVVVGQEPSLLDRLVRIVQFRVAAGLTTSATQLTNDLVDGLVEDGFISPRQANALIANVLAAVKKDDLGLLLLDPAGIKSLMVTDKGRVIVNGSGAIVVDSNNTSAALVVNKTSLTAADIDITGGLQTVDHSSFGGQFEHQDATPDPLGLSLPTPPTPTFAAVDYAGSAPLTLRPGTYVGGINIHGTGAVTLMPGVYYMQGGGFLVSGPGSVTGTGVTIINAPRTANDTIGVSDQGSLTLTAPTSGPFKGLAVFQDPALGNAVQFTGQAAVTLTGVVYAPAAQVHISDTAQVTINAGPGTAPAPTLLGALIASDLKIDSNGVLTINPDNSPSVSSPAGGFAAPSSGGKGTAARAALSVPVRSSGGSVSGDDSLLQASILLSRNAPVLGNNPSPAPVASASTSAANATLVDTLSSGDSTGSRASRSGESKGVKYKGSTASGVEPSSEQLVDAVFTSL
jgi:hypothetical protein